MKKYNCIIFNYWFTNNYVALLTTYALQTHIESLGLKVGIANCRFGNKQVKNGLSENFSKKYLFLTHEIKTISELALLNNLSSIFIVGSDQVLRYKYFWPMWKTVWQLDFAANNIKKIYCAASFGQDYFESPSEHIARIKYYLKKFDHISVRESSGVYICKDIFDVESTHILDPVFYLNTSDYDILIKKSKLNDNNFIATYILDHFNELDTFLNLCYKEFKTDKCIVLPNAYTTTHPKYNVEDWLYTVKNCKFFITDSFHGVCFALIFNKPFICIVNESRGIARFSSLVNTFKINNFIKNKSNFDITKIINIDWNIEYNRINKIIESERNKSIKWLENAIATPEPKKNDFEVQTQEIITHLLYKTDNYEENLKKLKLDIYCILKAPKNIIKYLILLLLSFITLFKNKKITSKYIYAKEEMKKLYNIIKINIK